MKGKKYNWITLWLLVACIALLTTGTFAAFTTVDYIKRVVSTTKGERPRFSSNYLYLVDGKSNAFSARRVTPTPVGEDGYTFTVEIYNFLYGSKSEVNAKEIQYQLKVTLKDGSGNSLTTGYDGVTIDGQPPSGGVYTGATQVMPAGTPTTNSYVFYVPKSLADHIVFEAVAEPVGGYYSATGGQKLAANIKLSSYSKVSNWTGKFIDTTTDRSVNGYDGFNYEINGNGAGTVTLTWNSEILQISPWFKDDVSATGSDGSLTFVVNSETQSAYQLQFYIKSRGEILNWETLEKLVTVQFTSGTNAAETTLETAKASVG